MVGGSAWCFRRVNMRSKWNSLPCQKVSRRAWRSMPWVKPGIFAQVALSASRGSMQFLPVDAFRINLPDLFGDIVGLSVFINGASATGNLEVIVDNRVPS